MSRLVAALLILMSAPVLAQRMTSSFPDSDSRSGRFINVTRGLSTLGDDTMSLTIRTSRQGLRLEIFDGDMDGRWDPINTSLSDVVKYTLYADPLGTLSTSTVVSTWYSNQMKDDDWTEFWVTSPAAKRNGVYTYHLLVEWATFVTTSEQNNFKVRVNADLYAPSNQSVGFIGYTPDDPAQNLFPSTTYDGTWDFSFRIEGSNSYTPVTLEVWNGDFDRADDTDDAETPTLPSWDYSVNTLTEGVRPGLPADDALSNSPLLASPAVWFSIFAGTQETQVLNPSGNREWERTLVSTTATTARIHIVGADGRNTLFLHANQPVEGPHRHSCGQTATIGYWKNHQADLEEALAYGVNLGEDNLTLGDASAILWAHPGGLSKLDAAKLKLSQQLIAALCNINVFVTYPEDKGFSWTLIEDSLDALQGTNIPLLNCLQTQIDRFNNSGDA